MCPDSTGYCNYEKLWETLHANLEQGLFIFCTFQFTTSILTGDLKDAVLFATHIFVLLQRTDSQKRARLWILINHLINVELKDVRGKKVSLAVSCSSAKIP